MRQRNTVQTPATPTQPPQSIPPHTPIRPPHTSIGPPITPIREGPPLVPSTPGIKYRILYVKFTQSLHGSSTGSFAATIST